MIRINLLPEDYRRAERTSPKLFATVLASVIAVCCSFGWFGFVYFGEFGQLELKHEQITEELTGLHKRVVYHGALSKEKADYQQRASTIAQISRSRVIWTKVLDEMIDVVSNDGNVERHRAWFRSVTAKDGGRRGGPTLTMPGWVQGSLLRTIADFHDDIERTAFFRNVVNKGKPTGDRQTDTKRKPPDSLFFSLKMEFLPPEEWPKDGN
jgi:Tfp pilus assembly protein PilN